MDNDRAFSEAFARLCSFCAKKERTLQEVRSMAETLGQDDRHAERLIHRLKVEGFLNEDRYAADFADSHFRNLGWGRIRIREALLAKGFSERQADTALSSIREEEYLALLERSALAGGKDVRLYQSLIRKGFEEELVTDTLTRLKIINTE